LKEADKKRNFAATKNKLTMENTQNQQPANQQTDGKTIAIVSYLTFIGWIIAIVMHSSNKTAIGAYHIRQSLGLWCFSIALYIVLFIVQIALLAIAPVIGIIFSFLWFIIWIGILVFWIMGLVNAINGNAKPIPLIGGLSEKIFAGIK